MSKYINKKPKIGIFMDDYYPSINGVNFVMDNCARGLSEYFDFVFVVPHVDRRYVDNFPYKVIRFKGVWTKKLGYTWATPELDFRARKELHSQKFDLIHIHSPFIMGRYGTWIARKYNVPVLGTIHTQFSYELDRLGLKGICKKIPMDWMRTTYNFCDECFTFNEADKDIFTEFGITKKISIIQNATDMTTSDAIDEDKKYINEKYNLDEADNVLLFVGRINIVKNIEFLLESLRVLADKGTKYRMLFVGPLEDEEIFCNKIEELNLWDYVKICGEIYDRDLLKKIYARADLLLLPSYYDTSSLVKIEAASQFTPTVFIENTPIASTIKNNYDGFVSSYEKNAYADKIAEVLNNKNLLHEVSQNCHESLYITWPEVCDNLLEHYKKYL